MTATKGLCPILLVEHNSTHWQCSSIQALKYEARSKGNAGISKGKSCMTLVPPQLPLKCSPIAVNKATDGFLKSCLPSIPAPAERSKRSTKLRFGRSWARFSFPNLQHSCKYEKPESYATFGMGTNGEQGGTRKQEEERRKENRHHTMTKLRGEKEKKRVRR